MHKIVEFLLDEINISFGIPRRVFRTLECNPEIKINFKEPEKSTLLESVIAWQNWSYFSSRKRNYLDCRNPAPQYSDFIKEILDKHDFSKLVTIQSIEEWKCDIRNIHGLSSSKTDLRRYSTLNEFALKGTYNFLEDISESNLNKILKHSEIRIINNSDTSDHFVWHQWDGRIFLVNGGGSHHFAAAHYIANKINKEVILTGRLDKYSFNVELILNLINDFEIFLIKESDIFGELYNSLNRDRVTFCIYWLPRQLENKRMFLLPKIQKKSERVAAKMRRLSFFDLGKYLYKVSQNPT